MIRPLYERLGLELVDLDGGDPAENERTLAHVAERNMETMRTLAREPEFRIDGVRFRFKPFTQSQAWDLTEWIRETAGVDIFAGGGDFISVFVSQPAANVRKLRDRLFAQCTYRNDAENAWRPLDDVEIDVAFAGGDHWSIYVLIWRCLLATYFRGGT